MLRVARDWLDLMQSQKLLDLEEATQQNEIGVTQLEQSAMGNDEERVQPKAYDEPAEKEYDNTRSPGEEMMDMAFDGIGMSDVE